MQKGYRTGSLCLFQRHHVLITLLILHGAGGRSAKPHSKFDNERHYQVLEAEVKSESPGRLRYGVEDCGTVHGFQNLLNY